MFLYLYKKKKDILKKSVGLSDNSNVEFKNNAKPNAAINFTSKSNLEKTPQYDEIQISAQNKKKKNEKKF